MLWSKGDKRDKELIAGIDLGSSAVKVAIGSYKDEEFDIKGVGISKSVGVRGGTIVDLDGEAKCIADAIRGAQSQAGIEVSSVFVGISGEHINLTTNEGKMNIPRVSQEIGISELREVMLKAKPKSTSLGTEIIHTIPSQFILDNTEGIKNPLGLFGKELKVRVTAVTALTTTIQNVIRCLNKVDLKVEEILLNMLATGEVVLYPEEKDLGVALIDIGGQLTNITIFKGEAPVYFSSLLYGGENLTREIATNFHISLKEAERIKKEYATSLRYLLDGNQKIDVNPGLGQGDEEKKIDSLQLAEVTEKKCEIMVFSILKKIENFLPSLGSGIVLTGGTSLLKGLKEMIEGEVGLPVRIGKMVKSVKGNTSITKEGFSSAFPYLTSMGLIAVGEGMRRKEYPWEKERLYDKTVGKVVNWVRDFF